MATSPIEEAKALGAPVVRARLLGSLSVSLGELAAGPWARPSARRLVELVLVSPGRRIGREAACEALYPHLGPAASANALYKDLHMARAALSALGPDVARLFVAERGFVFAGPEAKAVLEVDLEDHEQALRSGLGAGAGPARDRCLAEALGETGTLLEDEPYADWALRRREALESLRQEARLALARDRSRGYGRSGPADVVQAWEACLSADPACEEAATALFRTYAAQGRQAQATSAYQRCRGALQSLGLRTSPALDQLYAAAAAEPRGQEGAPARPRQSRSVCERRLVSVLFAELTCPTGRSGRLGPEQVHELVGGALAGLVAQVEAVGGTVTSISGAGLVALFGAPVAHEDDPERALRAAFRCIGGASGLDEGISLRAGVETGPAVIGLIGGGAGACYGAVGEVVGTAAALQSVARPASVLVGPATRAATEGIFDWGPTEEVLVTSGAKPLRASYLERPKATPAGEAGRRRLAGSAPLVGRAPELGVLREAVRGATAGRGGVLALEAEPGLGKTRLVHECRKLFMAWVGAASGRLPLWLEARAASYASSRPYGLYQQLLSSWAGAAADQGEELGRPALEKALRTVFARDVSEEEVGLLSQVLGFGPGRAAAALARLGPGLVQRATFEAVEAVVSRLVSFGPTVLVFEDLHWADPTSLRLTEELASLTLRSPLLLVLTHRPEPDPGVSALKTALGAHPGLRLRTLALAPLPEAAERDLARSLLGRGSAEELVETVRDGAEGNPLFLEERLASLQETHTLVRDDEGRWQLDGDAPGELPEAIERLVCARVDRLDQGPHDAVVAASVLGPEFSLEALAVVTDLEEDLGPAVSELCAKGLLVELRSGPEACYRFRHALIQEATYKSLVRDVRRRLHARAAWGLEQAWAARLEEVSGALGRHHALAGEKERAAYYLETAADHAATAFANDEAVASYKWALELLGAHPERSATQVVGLWLKLGRVFWGIGRYTEGQAAFEEATHAVPPGAEVLAARCYYWLGNLLCVDHRRDDAEVAFDSGEQLLQAAAGTATDDWEAVWLDIQLYRVALCAERNQPERHAELLAAVRPVVEARGTLAQKANFAFYTAHQRLMANRGRVDDVTLAGHRAAWALMQEAGLEYEMNWASFYLGRALLFHDDIAEAKNQLATTLARARRAGDRSLEMKCLLWSSCAHRREHDVDSVRQLALEAGEITRAFAYADCTGMVTALLSWVAWKEGRAEEAERLAEEALETWRDHSDDQWLCFWPLIAIRLADGRDRLAVEAARRLLGTDQVCLPDNLEAAVSSAISAWDNGQLEEAADRMGQALRLAEQLGHV